MNVRAEAEKVREQYVRKRSSPRGNVLRFDWYFPIYEALETSVPVANRSYAEGTGCTVDFRAAWELALVSRAKVWMDAVQNVSIRLPRAMALHSFWAGNCVGGVAQGPGVFVFYYIDTQATQLPWYLDRIFVNMKDGRMNGKAELVSESQFIPIYTSARQVAVAENGRLTSEIFSPALQDRVKGVEQARRAINSMIIGAVAKEMESLQSAKLEAISIEADCVTGMPCKVSGLSVQGPGEYEPSTKTASSGTIRKGPGGALAVRYSYSFTIERGGTRCAAVGAFTANEGQRNIKLNHFPDCRFSQVNSF
jgi:hypothetical protein